MIGSQLDAALCPGDLVEVLESEYAWAHQIVGKRALVLEPITLRDAEPGSVLIEDQQFGLYYTELTRLTDG